MARIFPSLISANLLNLGQEISNLDPYVAGYHLDSMDNHFVPNLTWGPAFIHAIAQATDKILWVHLMVDNPLSMMKNLKLPANALVSFHIETKENKKNIIDFIKDKGWSASIAISPKTPVQEILPFLDVISQALVMSVEPGHSGQAFLPETIEKVTALVDYRKDHDLSYRIGMDGGISELNIASLAQLGVQDFAIAKGIFGKPNPVAAVQELSRLIKV